MKKILNYRLIIATFLAIVFVCGAQIAFAEPVSAASYKKFDSGTIKTGDGVTLKYTSYIKGKNDIYVKLTVGKTTISNLYFVKEKTKIKVTIKSPGEKTQSYSEKHNGKSVKTYYNKFIKDFVKQNSKK